MTRCGCCSRTWRDGQAVRSPAAYIWTFSHGGTEYLCESCCAYWRQNAAADPELLPARVTTLC